MKNVRYFISKDNLEINLDNFGKTTNILLITGLSGSGKSTLALELSKKYNATVFELDNLGGHYGKYKNSNSLIYKLTGEFLKDNPTLDKIIKSNKFINLKLKSFGEYVNYNIKYFEFLVNYCNSKSSLFIMEGTQLFKCFNPDYFVNKSLIIVRTSILKSFFRRLKRQLKFKKNGFVKELKHLKKLINDSKRLHVKDVKVLNNFINFIQ